MELSVVSIQNQKYALSVLTDINHPTDNTVAKISNIHGLLISISESKNRAHSIKGNFDQ